MANIIEVLVDNLDDVRAIYDRIKVYKSTTVDGTYTEITNSSTRIQFNAQDSLYNYTDNSGILTDYYKTTYFNTGTLAESTFSNPVVAGKDSSIQLQPDMQVVISLFGSIADTNGNLLGNDIEYFFTTTYDPYYSSLRKLRLEIGSFVQDIDDDPLNLAIFEASLMADELTWIKPAPIANKFYNFARREWVTCKAAQDLLMNALSGLRSKRLDNFSVEYETLKRGQMMLDKIQACLDKWENQLKSGGHATQTPSFVVKGQCDPEAPHVGRLWEKGPFVRHVSGANLRYKPAGARRYIAGWRQNMIWRRLIP